MFHKKIVTKQALSVSLATNFELIIFNGNSCQIDASSKMLKIPAKYSKYNVYPLEKHHSGAQTLSD